jgi:hypothetical protein
MKLFMDLPCSFDVALTHSCNSFGILTPKGGVCLVTLPSILLIEAILLLEVIAVKQFSLHLETMTDSAPKQEPPYGLRMPPDLKQRVKNAAAANNRSMNAEIISRIERSFHASLEPVGIVVQTTTGSAKASGLPPEVLLNRIAEDIRELRSQLDDLPKSLQSRD